MSELGPEPGDDEEEERDESESEGVERPADLALVWAGGTINHEFEVGSLSVGEADKAKSVSVVLVSGIEGRMLAVFPHGGWAKKVKQRRLPAGPFSKPVLAEVAVASASDRRVAEPSLRMKVWFGLLDEALARTISFDLPGPADIQFLVGDQPRLPFAQALVEVAESQFGFMTAASAAPEPGDNRALEARLRSLETSLESVVHGMQKLMGQQVAPLPATTAPRSKAPALKPKAQGSIPGTPPPPGRAKEVPGLDPAVLQAAKDAGVQPDELRELSEFFGRRKKPLGDFPDAGAGLGDGDARSDFAGSEAAPSEGAGRAPAGAPIEDAVVTLTGLMKELMKDRARQSDRALTLESALDRAESSSWDGSGGSGSSSRSKAAAYRVLRESLKKRPEAIYQSIEALLEEDLLARRATGNLAAAQASARAWVEFRSRVGNYPSTIRAMWAIAGILDSLRDNCPEEARARACLALAAFDQQSIDSGAWVYAQEIMFEPSPPLSAFQSRRVVVSDPLESYHSKLLDPRVADVLLHRVKELESYLEAKKKLGRSKQSDPPGGRNDEDDSGKGGRGRGKGERNSPPAGAAK